MKTWFHCLDNMEILCCPKLVSDFPSYVKVNKKSVFVN